MSGFFSILKLLIKSLLRSNKIAGEKNSSKTAVIIVIAAAYLFIAAFICFLVYFLDQTIVEYNLVNELIAVLFAVTALIVLIFGLVALFNSLYFSRDSEFFLMLPVKPSSIFLAKFVLVYLTELIIAAAILVPSLITLGIVAALNPIYYLIILIGILLAPSLPLMIATIIAVPLMYIIGFFKNKGAITSIFMMLLFVAFFGVYFFFVMQMQSGNALDNPELLVENMKNSLTVLSNVVYPYLALARFATLSSFAGLSPAVSVLLSAVIFIGSTAALIFISVFIANIVYKRGAASQLENVKAKSTGKEKFEENSSLKALIKKEWKELIRTPAFAFQCLSGILLTPIMVAVFSFTNFAQVFSEGADGAIVTEAANGMQWFICFMFILMFGVGLNITAASAITREGKNFYFTKMIPVDYKTQLQAKQIVALTVSMTAATLGLIVLTVATLNFIFFFLGLVFCFLYSYGYNNFAIYFDLKKPKLDWATPNEAVKQNFRMMVPYLVNMVISIVFIIMPVVCMMVLDYLIASVVIWIVFFGLALIIFFAFRALINKNVNKLYESIVF